jgi:hypothetical protein
VPDEALRPLREKIEAQRFAEACEQRPVEVLARRLVEVAALKLQVKALEARLAAIEAPRGS